MSGIVGIYCLDGRPVEKQDVQRMADSIAHRGPDGSGVWTDGPVGLGHRMLCTTPESLHEKLPLTNRTGDLTITADARIDNRDELFSTLNFNGRPHEMIADSEIILAAYEKWGEKSPEKLLGDFAFAIWDKRKQTVFCARDPIGIRPFYYYFKDGKFRWSSEPKAIFEDKAIPKEPNLPLICLYLLDRFDEREETLYKDVYRLPPSHFMIIENGRIHKEQYWDIDPNYSIRYKTDEEYAEHFLSLFKEAVKVRLRSHGPVGALLSGGLDSSSVVCTAAKLYQDGVIPKNGFETFSIVFDNLPCDERTYIKDLVQMWNLKPNYIRYERNRSWVEFEKSKQYSDVGYSPTLLIMGAALEGAQKRGIRIILNGIGGDDLMAAGFAHLTDLTLRWKFSKLVIQLQQDAHNFSCSPYSLFLNYCLKPLIPRYIREPLKQVLKPFRRNGIPPWFNKAYIKKMEINERLKYPLCHTNFPTRSQQQIYQILRYGWNCNVAIDKVRRFIDYFSMETRFPFFDKPLIKFLFAIPEDQRWCGDLSKFILRRGMINILPRSIRERTNKAEFSPVVDWEMKHLQSDKLNSLFQKSVLSELGIILTHKIQQFLQKYHSGEVSRREAASLNTIIWLELYCHSVMKRM